MKCIVTGGSGFIGSHIVEALIEEGADVYVIDDESATAHEHFYYHEDAYYFKYDICDYNSIRPIFEEADYVFHLAAESRIQPTLENPIGAVKTNTLGTATVLQCAKESGVKKVMYSSTSSAYGLANKPPLKETMLEDCLNPYSVSKVAGEKLCKMYDDLFGLQTVTFRYFNVYGPREPKKGQYAPVIGLFLRQHKNGEPLTIIGDGEQRRDFTHVSDVVRANILAMKSEVHGELFNVGTGKNYSVNELASMISSNVKYIPPRPAEARESRANNMKIRALLGWSPTVKLEEYIKEQING